MFKSLLIACSMLLLAACANLDTVSEAATTQGVSKEFRGDYEVVKAATLASVQGLNVNIKQTGQDADGFNILFTKSISAFSWGEVGRVYVVKKSDAATMVYVHSEKRSKMQITGFDEDDFADSIFDGVTAILDKKKK